MIINSQLGGTKPTGTKNITTNGTHDVTDYATANVSVPTTAPAYYVEKTYSCDFLQAYTDHSIINLSNVKNLNDYVLAYAYYSQSSGNITLDMSGLTGCVGKSACEQMFGSGILIRNIVKSVDLSSLQTVSGENAFNAFCRSQTGLTTINLNSLQTVSGVSAFAYAFSGCTGLTSISLPALTTISARNGCFHMFDSCTNLTSIDISALTTVSGQQGASYMFNNCNKLTSVTLQNLTTISGTYGCGYMFQDCASLQTVSFPALKTVVNAYVFMSMLERVTGCTVHFPSNLSSYNFNCGGTNTTVLYDLPATN